MADVLVENIRAERGRANFSQADLAEHMSALGHNWGRMTVTNIERGERNVTVDELVGLALVFAMSPQDLLFPSGPKQVDLGPTTVSPNDVGAWLKDARSLLVDWVIDEVGKLRVIDVRVEEAPNP